MEREGGGCKNKNYDHIRIDGLTNMSKQLLQGINTLLAESKRGGYAGCLLRCSTVCMQMFVIKSLLDGVRTQRGKRKGIMFFFQT